MVEEIHFIAEPTGGDTHGGGRRETLIAQSPAAIAQDSTRLGGRASGILRVTTIEGEPDTVTDEKNGAEIGPATGKLGVLLVGLGAVSTTFIAGVEAIKRGLAEPIGSLTQMGAIRLPARTPKRHPPT